MKKNKNYFKKRIMNYSVKMIVLFFSVLSSCSEEPVNNNQISFDSIVYSFVSDEVGWISLKDDSIQIMRYIDLKDFECFQVYPLGILDKSKLGQEWTLWEDDCGVSISNQLFFTSKTIAIDTNRIGEIIHIFYQEIGRSHENNPCGKRYVFFSRRKKIFNIVSLDSCDLWPYHM